MTAATEDEPVDAALVVDLPVVREIRARRRRCASKSTSPAKIEVDGLVRDPLGGTRRIEVADVLERRQAQGPSALRRGVVAVRGGNGSSERPVAPQGDRGDGDRRAPPGAPTTDRPLGVARIERIAQALPEHVEAPDRQQDGHARRRDEPGRQEIVVLTFEEHATPGRSRG